MTAEPGSILVVDDDESNLDMLARRLRRRGYEVTVGRGGEEALAMIRDRAFDLILLDVMMPGINGFEVLGRLRERHPATELPVIMATAKGESEDVVHALGLGANDYVTKPLDFPVVIARVQTQIALKRAMERARRLEQGLAERNRELEAANGQLAAINRRMTRDLHAAARVQEALLPRTAPDVPGLAFAWEYRPCHELAGDGLNAVALGGSAVGLYVFDVSGHGVASALLSVSIARRLTNPGDPSSILLDGGGPSAPAAVAARLDRLFPFEPATEQYATLVYVALDAATGAFRYTCAGHPGPAHLPATGPPTILPGRGYPIGLAEGEYDEHAGRLGAGDRLYLYSDGVPEATGPDGSAFGVARLLGVIDEGRAATLGESVAALRGAVERWCGAAGVGDDVSILAVEGLGTGTICG